MSRSVVNEPSVEPQSENATWINLNSTTYPPTSSQPKARKSTRKRKKTDPTTAIQLNEIPNIDSTGNGDERPTKLDEIAWLITELKETITLQGQTIEALKTCCEELKTDQKELIRENASLKDEIAALKTQLLKPDQRTWASVASSGTNSQPAIPPLATTAPTTTKENRNDPPPCASASAQHRHLSP